MWIFPNSLRINVCVKDVYQMMKCEDYHGSSVQEFRWQDLMGLCCQTL